MNILGISCFFHDSAAVLIRDGELICAAEEERFSRIKHDFNFPEKSIDFCLKFGNIDSSQIDYVVFFEKPFLKFERILKTVISTFPFSLKVFSQSMRNWAIEKLWIKSKIVKILKIPSDKILFSDHHLSHAASSYFSSPFSEATVVTFDGVGEWASTTIGYAANNKIDIVKEIQFPHSIGLLYSVFTAFLGFEVNEGEYKVMGMASFGSPKYTNEIKKILNIYEDGSFWLDPSFFSFYKSTKKSFSKKFTDLFGPSRLPESLFFTKNMGIPDGFQEESQEYKELCKLNQKYADIAASIQKITEELVLGVCNRAFEENKSDNLCLSGGVALNSTANNRIIQETPFKKVFIQPASGDGGGALGAALLQWNSVLNNKKRFVMKHSFWGQEYSDDEIREILDNKDLDYTYCNNSDELTTAVAKRLVDGKIIGWFQGRFEWGPRSLGARSILADPRDKKMKEKVNEKIKFREPFRPFAPAILEEKAIEYFNLEENFESLSENFMLRVAKIKEEKRTEIPAVDHFGTGRLQTVSRENSPLFYELILKFFKITDTPVILNTSFNVRGDPIVNNPNEALDTFLKTDIDCFACGSFILDK